MPDEVIRQKYGFGPIETSSFDGVEKPPFRYNALHDLPLSCFGASGDTIVLFAQSLDHVTSDPLILSFNVGKEVELHRNTSSRNCLNQ